MALAGEDRVLGFGGMGGLSWIPDRGPALLSAPCPSPLLRALSYTSRVSALGLGPGTPCSGTAGRHVCGKAGVCEDTGALGWGMAVSGSLVSRTAPPGRREARLRPQVSRETLLFVSTPTCWC